MNEVLEVIEDAILKWDQTADYNVFEEQNVLWVKLKDGSERYVVVKEWED